MKSLWSGTMTIFNQQVISHGKMRNQTAKVFRVFTLVNRKIKTILNLCPRVMKVQLNHQWNLYLKVLLWLQKESNKFRCNLYLRANMQLSKCKLRMIWWQFKNLFHFNQLHHRHSNLRFLYMLWNHKRKVNFLKSIVRLEK